MANKITIQHLYTTSGTTAPNDLINGEIAISHATGNEAIFLKPREEPGKAPEEIKFIPEVRIKKMFEEAGIGSNDVITGLSSDLKIHMNTEGTTGAKGHVELKQGDLSTITAYTAGHAAASYHEHSQYLEENSLNKDKGFQMFPGLNGGPNSYGVKAGAGITVDANGVSINDEYQGKIANGATAYEWGDHKNAGYAKNSGLTALSDTVSNNLTATTKAITEAKVEAKNYASGYTDTEIEKVTKRITPLETSAETWNETTEKFNAFISGAVTGGTDVIDTLVEIQDFLSGDTTGVKAILDTVDNLTTKVENNTTAITANTSDISNLQTEVKNKVETIDASGNLSAVTGTTPTGVKKYTITHTAASAQTSAITAANNATGLSFGSEFEIVNKVGYDKNGHVVSGSSQTLKLPVILTQHGLTGTTGTDANGTSRYLIGHKNSFNNWNGKSTGITLNFNESFKIPIIDYEEEDGREPNLSGVDETGHLKNSGWTLTTFSLPNIISCGQY